MRYLLVICFTIPVFFTTQAQQTGNVADKANAWADSVLKTLSQDERIAQLMVVRLSSIDLKTKQVTFFDQQVANLIKQYNIGGICLFQGGPAKQAGLLNALQQTAKTPVLVCMDAEWGVGMRILDSVLPLPKQMMLGAMTNEHLVYKYGQVVAAQCKRMGIHLNYAPVVDVNNNPDNPVINDRSFGEDKYKVSRYGIQYMKGMQDMGVMACAKHFPGHGDVAVDSHFDLPVINKTLEQLDSLELYPFRQVFNAGITSAMIAHLYIPSIDNRPNRASSLSKANIDSLLRKGLHFDGLTFTDALEMQGVKKFFPNGDASVESLIAGNDMLCLPDDVPASIAKVKAAIAANRLSWSDIDMHCKKVLLAKYNYGITKFQPINPDNIAADLNSQVPAMTRMVAENAITLLTKNDATFFPLKKTDSSKNIVYLAVGVNTDNAFTSRMRKDFDADVFFFDYSRKDDSSITNLIKNISAYKKVVIGVHAMARTSVTNFGLSSQSITLINSIQQQLNAITFIFGNPYAVKNFCNSNNLVVCYEDNNIIQNTAADMLEGLLPYKGVLPVSVCETFKSGSGITAVNPSLLNGRSAFEATASVPIDSIITDAIKKKAMPGCVVLVAKDGRIAFEKSYGYYGYDSIQPVAQNAVYDIASITKICATTIAIMKLYDEGRIDLKKKLGDYLSWVKGSNKENISIEKLLIHQGGLQAYIPFYKETIDENGKPLPGFYRTESSDSFSVRVADSIYMRNDWKDSMYKRILASPVDFSGKYIYSDNDFIFLGKVVEAISGLSLDEYVKRKFYTPMSLEATSFLPLKTIVANRIVPTEDEKKFRWQLLKGYVHDPGAAMFGAVSGHAGLFSDAYDLACIMQMLLDSGMFNGKRYLEKETVALFTAYHSSTSRRGYGFDKPEKDNNKRQDPYPCISASASTFGHTGFTGTCAWADPDKKLVFVFLSNRVNPDGENKKLNDLNVRGKIMEAVYEALK